MNREKTKKTVLQVNRLNGEVILEATTSKLIVAQSIPLNTEGKRADSGPMGFNQVSTK